MDRTKTTEAGPKPAARWLKSFLLLAAIPLLWVGTAKLSSSEAFLGAYTRSFGLMVLSLAATLGILWGVYYTFSLSRPRDKILNGILSGCSTALVIGFLELPAALGWVDYAKVLPLPSSVKLARLMPWQRPGGRFDPELLFIHQPGLHFQGEIPGELVETLGIATSRRYTVDVQYDLNGFRNHTNLERAPIVAIGDSFVEAGLVAHKDLLTTRLSDAFQVDVANLGHHAFGPPQELIVLRRFALPLQPRVVLWFFFEGNDLSDVPRFEAWKNNVVGGPPRDSRFRDRSLVRNAIDLLPGLLKFRARGEDAIEAIQRSCRLRFAPRQTIYFGYGGAPLNEAGRAALQVVYGALLSAKAQTEKIGGQFLLLYVPTKFRVYQEFCDFPANGYGRKWHSNELPQRLRDWSRENNFSFLDLTQTLRTAAANGELSYFPDDSHWNANAHRIVAETIADYIRVSGWARSLKPQSSP